MSRGDLTPKGNEGEPTWWERNRETVFNIQFSLAELKKEFEQPARVFADSAKLKQRYAWKHGVGQEILRDLTKKFGEESTISVKQFYAFARMKAYSSQIELGVLDDFLTEIVYPFVMQNEDFFQSLIQDDDFRGIYSEDEDEEIEGLTDRQKRFADQIAARDYIAMKVVQDLWPNR